MINELIDSQIELHSEKLDRFALEEKRWVKRLMILLKSIFVFYRKYNSYELDKN